MLCGSHNEMWNLVNHVKKLNKNIRLLVFSFSAINLAFWCFLFCFFMWFARFQSLICEPQTIWRKLLVLSWLYYLSNKRNHCVQWTEVENFRPIPILKFSKHLTSKKSVYLKYYYNLFFVWKCLEVIWKRFHSFRNMLIFPQ